MLRIRHEGLGLDPSRGRDQVVIGFAQGVGNFFGTALAGYLIGRTLLPKIIDEVKRAVEKDVKDAVKSR